jgi:hypothetical protein
MYFKTEISVLFEEPFWVALIEREIDNRYSVARAIIGTSEPSGATLVDFFDRLNCENLWFSEPVKAEYRVTKEVSFKKQLHKNREFQDADSLHTYTKAHAMLKQQQSELKTERKKVSRLEKEESVQLKFDIRQQKKKEKHKGH